MLMSNGKIILAGGSTPKHGKLNTVFEYHPVFGFKLLETTLAAPRLVKITTKKKHWKKKKNEWKYKSYSYKQ